VTPPISCPNTKPGVLVRPTFHTMDAGTPDDLAAGLCCPEEGFACLSQSQSPLRGRTAIDNAPAGIALVLLASVMFAVMSGLVKWVSPGLPVIEIAFIRQMTSVLLLGSMAIRNDGLRLPSTRRPLGHLFRGLIGNFAMIPYVMSYAWLPLADATALSFVTPLCTTVLSIPMLGERVGPHRLGAVLIGLAAVLIMARPEGNWFTPGAGAGVMAGLVAAFTGAVMIITVRRLSRTEPSTTIVFYFSLTGAVMFGAFMPFCWVPPRPQEWIGLIAIGLFGGGAQLVMTHGYRYAPAGTLAPFSYASILWSTAIGFLVWHQLPGGRTLVGAIIIISSGLYILYRESRARHAR
jgi:drug/metabolite transporter (DMT)-like permease